MPAHNTTQYALPALVEMFWWDHYSMGDDWHDRHYRHEPCILSAVGYVVDEDDMYYWVASTFEIATSMYSAGTAVLKNCVAHIENLRPARFVSWNGQPPTPKTTRRK